MRGRVSSVSSLRLDQVLNQIAFFSLQSLAPQRGDCQEKKHDRQAKRVVVSAQVSDDGADKKQDEAGGGGDSNRRHADTDEQSERAGRF